MIIFRYLLKQVVYLMLIIIAILAMVFFSYQFVHALSLVTLGKLPLSFMGQLMAVELPLLLWLIIPISLFLALIISLSQMYLTNEITILNASGLSPTKIFAYCMFIASMAAISILAFAVFLRPILLEKKIKLLHNQAPSTFIKTLKQSRFYQVQNSKKIIYLEKINTKSQTAANIFLAEKKHNQWEITTIKKAQLKKIGENEVIIMENGEKIIGKPGDNSFLLMKFKNLTQKLKEQEFDTKSDVRTYSMSMLLEKPITSFKASEIQFRLAYPILIIVLSIIALPLSKTKPRQDKYSQVVSAVAIFLIYANLLAVSRKWIMYEKIPVWLGMWWVHGLMIGIAAFIFFIRKK